MVNTIAVVGLGYVGLPLAVEFGKKYRTLGFDLSEEKVESYKRFVDPTGEISSADLKASTQASLFDRPGSAVRGGLHRGRCADASRRCAPARLHAAGQELRESSAGT